MRKPIINPDEITPSWLTTRLKETGILTRGCADSVLVGEQRRPGVYPLEVTYSSDVPPTTPRRFIYKTVKRGTEGLIYRDMVSVRDDFALPPCYDIVIGERYQSLLIRDISDTHFLPVPPWWEKEDQDPHGVKERLATYSEAKRAFDAIIDEYVRIQAAWWENPRLCQHSHLRPDGEVFIAPDFAETAEAIPVFFEKFGDRFSRKTRALCDQAVSAMPRLFGERSRECRALSLVHIDFHIHNIFLPRDWDSDRPIIADWEGAVAGIGVYAVAHLLLTAGMSHDLRRDYEERLLDRYQARLQASGVREYSLADCHHDYRLSVMANICYPIVKGVPGFLETTMQAFSDWNCADLLE